MLTWKEIEDDIIYSKLLGIDISNTFYHEVLEYYFGDISLFMDYNGQVYSKNDSEVSTFTDNVLFLREDIEDYIETKYDISRYVLYDLVHEFLLYKHNRSVPIA